MINTKSIISLLFLTATVLILACNPKQEEQTKSNNSEPTSTSISSLDVDKIESQKKLENFDYNSLTGIDILNLEHLLSDKVIHATEPDNNQLKAGSIVIYKTSKRLIGKLQIIEHKMNLRFKATTYLRDGSKAYQIVDAITLTPGTSFDLDKVVMTIKDRDFSWDILPGNKWIISPKNRTKFYVQTKN